MNSLWLLLLPVAATFGWASARRNAHSKGVNDKQTRSYLNSLNLLLNQEPDKAVDSFIKGLDVDTDTIETHLALGNLYRRRGEMSRAIRIHQNLIARPQLQLEHRNDALLALARDYLSAGVLDRAENLFKELLDLGEHTEPSLRALLYIYQQEKDWRRALLTAQKIAAEAKHNVQTELGQFNCELAEITLSQKDYLQTVRYAKQALTSNRDCVRASLLLGQMEIRLKKYERAALHLQRVQKQNADYLLCAIPWLIKAYRAMDKKAELINVLKALLASQPNLPIIMDVSALIQEEDSDQAALSFVAEHVKAHPSLVGLHDLVGLRLLAKRADARDDLDILKQLTDRLLKEQNSYRCVNCGFAGHTLHWHCPSCKQWETTKPAYLTQDV